MAKQELKSGLDPIKGLLGGGPERLDDINRVDPIDKVVVYDRHLHNVTESACYVTPYHLVLNCEGVRPEGPSLAKNDILKILEILEGLSSERGFTWRNQA